MPRWVVSVGIAICVATAAPGLNAQAPFTEEGAARGLALFMYGGGEGWGRGMALNDLDGDGDLDVAMTGSITGAMSLWENSGAGNFSPRDATGIPSAALYNGITAADYDADGDLDLYLANYNGPNVLVRNDGNFNFTDVTATAMVGDAGHTAGCAWGDYDGDGWIDLLVTNHSPQGTENNRLMRNLGDGTFDDVTDELLLQEYGPSFQALFFDYDRDGDSDLYVTNDKGPTLGYECRLWRNDDGVLTDVSASSGAGIFAMAMGLGVGDPNRDGYLDLYVTNTPLGDDNILLVNQGDGTFTDESSSYGIGACASGWGVELLDFDNDGYEDIFVLDGGIPNSLYHGGPTLPYPNIAQTLGLALIAPSYSVSAGDVDLDGDLDLVVSSSNWPLELYINHEGETRNWIDISLDSATPNTRAIGAIVDIVAGGVTQTQAVYGTGSYKNSIPYSLHFGLDTATTVDSITVLWPGGGVSEHGPFDANQRITLDDSTAIVPQPVFIRGDVNSDGSFDIADSVLTLSHLFLAEPIDCLRSADSNSDQSLDVADAVYSLSALFGLGSAIDGPHPACGEAASALSCVSSPNCP